MLFKPLLRALALCVALAIPSAALAERQWFETGPVPSRYEISITPNADAGTFAGEARIVVRTSEPQASITMNALDLSVRRATIDGAGVGFDTDADAQTLTLTPRHALRPGRHVIRVLYDGKIYDQAYGLFRVSYQADGATKRALATQFEPGDARRLAPMWDQPNRRAVFSLTVTAPADQLVVSNMPAARSVRLANGLQRVTFADTPSMASYLLFLAVGDFERVTTNVDGVELGVVVRRGEGHRAQEALRAGEQSLRYYTEYFGIRYPLPKLDMVGVPGAGGFGAMENWGAILYFDQYLLVDSASSVAERQDVFGIVAHEIAHQWFGDLVTMNWWDDLWLNEGFASWMAAKATEAVHPEWRPWLSQMSNGTATAMALDAREGTHPIVQQVDTIEEANLAFDSITYEKGLAVLRMIEAYVGEEDFRRGVRDYLNAHLYGNARTEDLWRAVQAASGQPILDIARGFTGQPGFPVLEVNGGACISGAAPIAVTQRRFAMDDISRTNELWAIPVVSRRLQGETMHVVLPAQTASEIHLAGCGPYLVNAGQSGLFRVHYDRANLDQLAGRFRELDPADQLGLLLDYWAFGRSGDAPFTDYLDLASRIGPDADPLIVTDTAGSMLAFATYAKGRPSEAMVREFGRRTLRPFFDRLAWEERPGETANDGLARAQLITALGELGDDAIIAESRRRVRSPDPNALPAGIRGAVISVYAANASVADYEDMLARARGAADFVEQRRLWNRLAGAKDPALARRTLDMTLGDEIPVQLRPQVIANVAGEHPRMAWDFIVAHRAAVEAMLDPLQRLEYASGIATASSDPAIADALVDYARNFPDGAQRSVASAAATIRLRAQTIAQRMPAVEAWIAARNAPPQRASR